MYVYKMNKLMLKMVTNSFFFKIFVRIHVNEIDGCREITA